MGWLPTGINQGDDGQLDSGPEADLILAAQVIEFSYRTFVNILSQRRSAMKKIYLSRSDRKIGGVCGGIGEYFDKDPTLIRIIVILLILFSFGFGVLASFLSSVA
jgi:phage shock protein C